MKRVAITAIIVLLISGSVLGQAKVGTTGPQFLELMPTVRSQATGSQMILFGDANGHFYNPAFLTSRPQHILSLSTIDLPSDVAFYTGAATYGSLQSDGRGLHVGFSLRHLTSGEVVERTYDQGTIEGTQQTIDYDGFEHRLVAAYAFNAPFNLSVGAAAKWIREDLRDYDADGYAFDIGLAVHHRRNVHERISIQPFASVGYRNLGPDMEVVENEYPLPRQFSLGWGATFAYHGERVALLEATPLLEVTKPVDHDWSYPIGIEAGIVETAYIRAGDRGYGDINSDWGYGFTTTGIQKLLLGDVTMRDGLVRWLAANLHFSFDYAHRDIPTSPYSFSIML